MGKSNQDLLNIMIEDFQKSDEGKDAEGKPIVIEHAAQGGYTDIKAKLLKAIPAKTTPTMAYAYPDHVAEYINAGAVLKLDDMIANEEYGFSKEEKELEDYAMYWSEGTCYDKAGSVYSVPYTKSTEVIFYNKTVFEEMGYSIPTKWFNDKNPNDVTTMFGLCRKMKADYEGWFKKHNKTATPDQISTAVKSFVPLGYDSDDNMYITLSAQLGIPYTSINDDMTPNNTLKAIHLGDEYIYGTIRFSFDKSISKDDVDYVIDTLAKQVAKLRAMSPVTKTGRAK